MTLDELHVYLRVPQGERIHPAYVKALAPIPQPVTDDDRIALFGAFLRAAVKAARYDSINETE